MCINPEHFLHVYRLVTDADVLLCRERYRLVTDADVLLCRGSSCDDMDSDEPGMTGVFQSPDTRPAALKVFQAPD